MMSGKGEAPGKGVPPRALTQPQGCFVQKACFSPSQEPPLGSQTQQ